MAQLTDTIKYLDFTGLQTYDGLIKGLIASGDAANSTEIENAIKALDVAELDASATGEAIVKISETDGKISATKGTVAANKVTVAWDSQDPESETTNVQSALSELYGIVALNAEAGEVAVYTDVQGTQTKVNTIDEFGKTYTFKQGTTTIATMNLAKDMVVSGGSVITAAAADVVIDSNVIVGEKYIKLNIANSTDVLYIPVNSLYKDHTAAANASKIQLTISNDNVISADVVSGSIAKSDLTTAVQNQLDAKTTLTEKATGHVLVTKTAGSGATGDNYAITEDDIASAELVGTLPNGISATTVTGYVAEAAGAAESKATRITVNGQSQNASTGAITIAGDQINVNSASSGTVAAAQTNADINNSDKIDVAFGKVLKKINDVDSDVTALETFVGNLTAITSSEIEGLFPSA